MIKFELASDAYIFYCCMNSVVLGWLGTSTIEFVAFFSSGLNFQAASICVKHCFDVMKLIQRANSKASQARSVGILVFFILSSVQFCLQNLQMSI